MTDWHTRAIIYQIDTALFYDLNGDGCGDIAGIAAKLRYIRRMGATVIWITPFYLTPFSMKATTSATISRWIPLRKAGRYHRLYRAGPRAGHAGHY
jgi:glycosidase